jgi:hypothetical protein
MKKCRLFITLLMMLLLCTGLTEAQQVIGPYPEMDGGFEGQIVGALVGTSVTSGTQRTDWTTRTAGSGTIDSSAVARTGWKFANFYSPTLLRERLQSPTAGANAIPDATIYTVQYYYRTSGATPPASYLRVAVSSNGTGGLNVFTGQNPVGTNGTWTLYRDTVRSSTTTGSPKYGLGSIGNRDTAMSAAMDVDDYVVYPGFPDVTSPDAPTSPSVVSATSSQIELSWTAPVTGADSGGYMVVRKALSAPSATPNVNGIYALGSQVVAGEVVAYLGTGTTFTDNGLTPSTHYYYRIFTVDKAFNYSATTASIDGSTSAPNYAPEPTVQVSGVGFTPASTSMTVSWTNGNGSNRLVLIRAGSAVNVAPSDGASYGPNTVFGSGTQLGVGNYVVFNGTGNSVTVTGLSKLTPYHVAIFEFNGSAGTENYLTSSSATGNQSTLPGSIVSAQSGDWATGSTWVGGVVPSADDDVTIATGHTVSIPATEAVYNLTVSSGATLYTNLPLPVPTTSVRYIRVNGSTVTTDGLLGGVSDAIGIEFWSDITLSGTGTLSPSRLRPGGNLSNVSATINQNMTLTYTGSAGTGGTALYTENSNNDNITVTVNPGKTLTLVDFANFYTTNDNSNAAGNSTVNINGNLDLSGPNSNMGLKTGAGKSCQVNVNGSLTVGRNFNATSTAGGGVNSLVIGGAGSVTVGGIADFTDPAFAITGDGSFTLSPGASIYIGSADGISSTGSTGNVQCASRNFSSAANYRYVGIVPQITGSGLPATINRLTISDSLGVTLTASVTVNDTLHTSTGDLDLNGKIITLGPSGYLREPAGNSVFGSGGYITTTRTLTAPSDLDDIAGLGVRIGSTADLGATTITRGHAVQSGINSIRRYYDIGPATNTGLNATLVFQYNYSQLNGALEEDLRLFRSPDAGTSWELAGGIVDTTANTITLTGVNSFSRWTAAGYAIGVPITAGWNLISNPVGTANDSLLQLFPTSSFTYAFEFIPGSGYAQRQVLVNGVGYWAKFPAATTQYLGGIRRSMDTVEVASGWNMIGMISSPVDTGLVVSDPVGLRSSNWYAYNGGYTAPAQLVPGKAYWVKASAAGKFIISAPGLTSLARTRENRIDPLASFTSVTISDGRGSSQTLYIGCDEDIPSGVSMFELPPPAPEGGFDARFESPEGGTMLKTYAKATSTSVDIPVTIRADAFPLVVSWNVRGGSASFGINDGVGGKLFRPATMAGEGALPIINNKVTRLILRVSKAPEFPSSFALMQNYPNPFNPSTTVKIALPMQSRVTLRVFNMLGQLVADVASGTYDEGYHSFTWSGRTGDGTPAGSGVYFCKFEASSMTGGESFSQVRKMVLMK